jgi:hypothetical protein
VEKEEPAPMTKLGSTSKNKRPNKFIVKEVQKYKSGIYKKV